MHPNSLSTLVVTLPLPKTTLKRLKSVFPTMHYHPDGNVPEAVLGEVDVFFTSWDGLPHSMDSFSKTPSLALVQLPGAGADKAVKGPAFLDALAKGHCDVSLASASGLHVLSVPPYVVMTILALYHQLPKQILIARNEVRWAGETEVNEDGKRYFARSMRGKTVGLLGYGHIAREAARLMQPFGVTIIAANSSGTRKKGEGYIMTGTASIPSTFYSTSDVKSFKAFLSRADILVASLPSTKETRYLLDRERLGWLPHSAILINVGRGDLFKWDDLLTALDRPNGLFGAALDVTDPEPLPTGHPLFTHPRVIITHHLSGNAEGEMDLATDILLHNVERLRKGEKLVNVVDIKKGY